MKKVLAIVGPTAVGKTSFGIECANMFNGEIISGDSIQIYKGLDIGSAKATKEEFKKAKHHLIDIKEPTDSYSVKEFQELSRSLIEDISKRNKLPIIVGGTGLYIKACLYDYVFYDESEKDNQYEELSNQEIYDSLKEKDPKALESIHINNRKRLVRALNIYEKHSKGISEIKDNQKHEMLYDAKIIGLTCERDDLYRKVEKRIDQMIEEELIKEIEGLLRKGVSFENQSMQAIGYKEFKDYFNGNKNLNECIEEVKRNTKHFVKRQYTFFNNQMPIEWYSDINKALESVKNWYE